LADSLEVIACRQTRALGSSVHGYWPDVLAHADLREHTAAAAARAANAKGQNGRLRVVTFDSGINA
jgi:hypothetical protein